MLKPLEDLFLLVLNFFFTYVEGYGGYGTAIVLLTVTIRLVLLPLDIGRIKSTQQMQKIQPKLRELQQKHKKDKQRQQHEMAKLFSEHKVNPISGCLPMLLQIPVFIALFVMLRNTPELRGTAFLWLSDLSKNDPIFILPLLTVVTTFFSFWLTASDPQQQRLMFFMSIPMGFIAFNIPAGVLVYWVTTNSWTIGQTYFMYAEERAKRKLSSRGTAEVSVKGGAAPRGGSAAIKGKGSKNGKGA